MHAHQCSACHLVWVHLGPSQGSRERINAHRCPECGWFEEAHFEQFVLVGPIRTEELLFLELLKGVG